MRLILVSRDPMIGRSFGRRLRMAGVEIVTGHPDWASVDISPLRPKDMIVLGPGDLRRLSGGLGPSADAKAILVGVPAANVAAVLSVLSRFGRPRIGDGIVVLEDQDVPLDAVISLAANGYLALRKDVVISLVERASFQRLGSALGSDDRGLLSLLAKGLANQQIAESLGWEQSRVKSRLRVLMRRLNLRNRTAAAVAAFRLGLGNDKG